MSDHVVVRIGKNAQKYHRPAGDDNTKPACWVTEKDDPDTEYKKWDKEQAEVWKEECQYPDCYGEKQADTSEDSQEAWPV